MKRAWVGVLWSVVVACLLPTLASASDVSKAAEYHELIGEAVREFDGGNFEEARSLFARAHRLLPNARTHRGLGYTEFELRNYGECIKQLSAALASDVKPLTEHLRQETGKVLARARRFVGRVILEVEPKPTQILTTGQMPR